MEEVKDLILVTVMVFNRKTGKKKKKGKNPKKVEIWLFWYSEIL